MQRRGFAAVLLWLARSSKMPHSKLRSLPRWRVKLREMFTVGPLAGMSLCGMLSVIFESQYGKSAIGVSGCYQSDVLSCKLRFRNHLNANL
jgi:hypothetical protein